MLTNAISVMNTGILEPRSIPTGVYLFSPGKKSSHTKVVTKTSQYKSAMDVSK